METAACLIESNEPVYPLDLVRTMRDQRAMLIQTAVNKRRARVTSKFKRAKYFRSNTLLFAAVF